MQTEKATVLPYLKITFTKLDLSFTCIVTETEKFESYLREFLSFKCSRKLSVYSTNAISLVTTKTRKNKQNDAS